ncbi:muscular LMNA-interacting protein isoform X2 [Hippoglossus hippoglossus]|uniref:muscular LMNA-interacting protein isoform X2 n=1 Tax=Hippoglossus hippoglossus TaxID=8267 RepID=UPI00148B4E3E|nr:muscular LMNA-interacting protein isoform X2 [Hippoglossus hippoglossus]
MDSLTLGKVSIGVPSGPSFFTFVPVVQKLPFESIIAEEEEGSGARTGKTNKIAAESHERTSGETMSERNTFKGEIVFIKDAVAGGAGSTIPAETELRLKSSEDHMSLSHTKASPSVSAQPENTPNHTAAVTASMETAVDKHRAVSQRQCHDTSGRAEVSSGCFANSVLEERTSPTCSADLFPTLASSRESLLSDISDKDRCWSFTQPSSVTSPVSFSRTVSPCSSVRSGMFTPSVTQIKRHFLSPGSSLVQNPQTCFSSCESLFSSICPQSPPPRHRPPLTRLSLLTAILRKGRLPVLSAALQRPYTPCWPVNPVTLSFCNACSAASNVASIPLEFSSRFSSSVSIDSQSLLHEPKRCVASPLPVQSNELDNRTSPQTQVKKCSEQIRSSRVPRWEQVISPPPMKKLSRAPLPLFCSNVKSVSPAEHDETFDCATSQKLQHTQISVSQSPELNARNTHMHLQGHEDNNFKNLISLSPKLLNEQENSVPQKWNHPSNSSLSRLHLLSQKLSFSPVCPPQLQPPPSRSPTLTTSASPLPRLQNTRGRCESERSWPASKASTAPSQAFHKAECLSPSHYTPISFLGWPSPACSPTPAPSPAPPIRDLTPSPSLSLRSATPSSRPGSGISDCSDREGKKRKINKIKLSYKSLAAIPTNTLLLDQQVIDEQVEREESPCDSLDRGAALDRGVADTHAEMCSPAQLRQQSEELYAVIDEVLANSTPASSRSSTPNFGLQNNSTLPKSLGRETKYASLSSLYQSGSVDRKLTDPRKTKPGVIRPMTAIPRLTVQDVEEFRPNPFRQPVVKRTLIDDKKAVNVSPVTMGEERTTERKNPFSVCDLQITEPEDQITQCAKDASAPSSQTEGRMKAFETHI